ncbi:MAG: tellurite resistance TerB family protein, partial [Ramlibacter sp.]
MFSTLQELFDKFTGGSPQDARSGREHALHLAAAVLLVEVMRSDASVTPVEREAVRAALGKRLALDEHELASLVAQAESQAKQANDYFGFTSRINDHCSQEDKAALVEAMWGVAYADGVLDANEIHVISKVAG